MAKWSKRWMAHPEPLLRAQGLLDEAMETIAVSGIVAARHLAYLDELLTASQC